METAIRTFWTSSRFAVAGASSDPSKYGHKVLLWYLSHDLPVTPINPKCSSITLPRPHRASLIPTVPTPSDLGTEATQTALSIITPPTVTRQLLDDAHKVGVRAVWLQPGSFDSEVLAYARYKWPDSTIAGYEEAGKVRPKGGEGWCVLVDGEDGLKLLRRRTGKL